MHVPADEAEGGDGARRDGGEQGDGVAEEVADDVFPRQHAVVSGGGGVGRGAAGDVYVVVLPAAGGVRVERDEQGLSVVAQQRVNGVEQAAKLDLCASRRGGRRRDDRHHQRARPPRARTRAGRARPRGR